MIQYNHFNQCCHTAYSDDDDLFDVKSELIPAASQWKSIGIALRLKPTLLDSIQAKNSSDSLACLTSMVTEWLERNYKVEKFGKPTWQWLVKVVGHPGGGDNKALAEEIAKNHKAGGMYCMYCMLIHCIVSSNQ